MTKRSPSGSRSNVIRNPGSDWSGKGSSSASAWTALAGCIIYTAAVLMRAEILGILFCTPGSGDFVVWTRPLLSVASAAAAVFLTLVSHLRVRAAIQGGGHPSLEAAAPLAFLPVCVLGAFLRPLLPQAVAGNILFFVPVAIVSTVLLRLLRLYGPRIDLIRLGTRTMLVVSLAATVFYCLVGQHFTRSVGEHSGDEGHYLTQAQSLYYDHDLDILNQVGEDEEPLKNHVSPSSRDGHWYSWHSFGLSLLLAPIFPYGIAVRHIMLGAIAGLGCGALVVCCRLLGARTRWAFTAILLFAFSSLWGVYSSRCLPEVLGATLALWMFAAVFMQERRPWGSLLIAVLCAAFLPWAQTRFIPVSLMGAAAYVLLGLLRRRTGKQAPLRLAAFVILYAAGCLAYYAVQSRMFDGASSYPVRVLLFSMPEGAWLALASHRGLFYTIPVACWLMGAALWVLFKDRKHRAAAAVGLALLLSVLATSCTTRWYSGGASMPGRFMVVVIPLLVAPAALALDRAGRVGRWWFIFLGLVSCVQFALMLVHLPHFDNAFVDPPGYLPAVLPLLEGLARPFSNEEAMCWYGFPLFLLAGTTAIVFLGKARMRLQVVIIILMVLRAVSINEDPGPPCRRRNNRVVRSPLYPDTADIYRYIEQDTLEDAAAWMAENLPPGSRVAVDADFPAHAGLIYERHGPFESDGARWDELVAQNVDFVVTSSNAPSGMYPRSPNAAFLLKEFDLGGKPLDKPVVRVYWTGNESSRAERDHPAPYLASLPVRERQRYEHAYLNGFGKTPLDMHVLGNKKKMVRFLVSGEKLQEIAVFCLAAWEPSRLRISLSGGRAREMTVSPGGHGAVVLRARRCYPFTGNHYRVTVDGDSRSNCLVRIATNPRDIGRMFLALGDTDRAAAYLEKAVTEDQLQEMPVTSLLESLAARRFETEELDDRYFRNSERTDNCLYHRAEASEDDVFLSGPYYPVPPGSYEAVFRLRARPTGNAGDILRLEVTSDRGSSVLAEHELASWDTGPSFQDISLRFATSSWQEGLEFRARALGSADFCIDHITLIPEASPPDGL